MTTAEPVPSGTPTGPVMPALFLGRRVHYVAYGTADGKYPKTCRLADVTEVCRDTEHLGEPCAHLLVINPTGLFFPQHVRFDAGGETPGAAGCPMADTHGNPFRYCRCGWTEATQVGGTWHAGEGCEWA